MDLIAYPCPFSCVRSSSVTRGCNTGATSRLVPVCSLSRSPWRVAGQLGVRLDLGNVANPVFYPGGACFRGGCVIVPASLSRSLSSLLPNRFVEPSLWSHAALQICLRPFCESWRRMCAPPLALHWISTFGSRAPIAQGHRGNNDFERSK